MLSATIAVIVSQMMNDSIDIRVRKMKVITVINIFIIFCASVPQTTTAVQPSTFGGFVNSFGRLTNTIKVIANNGGSV